MDKRKAAGIAACILLLCTGMALFLQPFGRKPFSWLDARQIDAAYITMTPPGQTVEVSEEDQLKELADIFNSLILYQRDESGRSYVGQMVEAKLILRDGAVHIVGAYNPFLFYDGKCYRTKYQPCERLNQFGNRLLRE